MSKKRQRHDREQVQADAVAATDDRCGKHFRRDPNSEKFVTLTPQEASRLIYPNPVCFLTTRSSKSKLNVMTLSWLAPANNYGGFVFVIHKTRFSASCLIEKKEFMLSVASSDQIQLLLACGKVSGSTTDKFGGSIAGLALQKSEPSSKPVGNAYAALQDSCEDDSDNESTGIKETELMQKEATLIPVAGTVANMTCEVIRYSDAADAGHWLVVAQITEAHVSPYYWDGKVFEPTIRGMPGLLSFLGSQQFGVLTANPVISRN